jgi:cyanate permease
VFVERGFDASAAGLLLSLSSVTGIVGGLVTPVLAAR